MCIGKTLKLDLKNGRNVNLVHLPGHKHVSDSEITTQLFC